MKKVLEKITEFWGKYKSHILYGIIIVFLSSLSFNTCKEEVKAVIMKDTYEKVDSINQELIKVKEARDSLDKVITERKTTVRVLYSNVDKIDKTKLKKDEETIRKAIANDSLSVDGIIQYWTREFTN